MVMKDLGPVVTPRSVMHMQRVPIAVGHADLAFTMRTYVHAQDGALRAAADTLQRVVTLLCQRTGFRTSAQPGAVGFRS